MVDPHWLANFHPFRWITFTAMFETTKLKKLHLSTELITQGNLATEEKLERANFAGFLSSSCSFLIDTPFDLTRVNCKVVFWPPFLGWNFVIFLGDLFSNLVLFSFIQDNMIINDC